MWSQQTRLQTAELKDGGWMRNVWNSSPGSRFGVCVRSEDGAVDGRCLTWTQTWRARAADFCWVMNFLLKQDVGEESSGWLNQHRWSVWRSFYFFICSPHTRARPAVSRSSVCVLRPECRLPGSPFLTPLIKHWIWNRMTFCLKCLFRAKKSAKSRLGNWSQWLNVTYRYRPTGVRQSRKAAALLWRIMWRVMWRVMWHIVFLFPLSSAVKMEKVGRSGYP